MKSRSFGQEDLWGMGGGGPSWVCPAISLQPMESHRDAELSGLMERQSETEEK